MSGEHAILAPSSAPIWGFCSGSVNAQRGRIPRVNQRTIDGSASHWVGAEVLQCHIKGDSFRTAAMWIGARDPDQTFIDAEMAEGAQTYVDEILRVVDLRGAPITALCVEQRVHMPAIHLQNWGTLDAFLASNGGAVWDLWDYKFGHLGVDPEENLQMIDYIEGKKHELGVNGHDDQHIRVNIHVVQPFCYDGRGVVRTWSIMLHELRPYFNQLHAQAHRAIDSPTLTPGKHCRHCEAVVDCSAARRMLYDLKDWQDSPFALDAMTSRDLRVEASILEDLERVVKSRREAIQDQLKHLIKNGDTASGLLLETSEGRAKFSAPDSAIIAMFKAINVEAVKPKLLTPNQVLQATPKALKETAEIMIKQVTTRPTVTNLIRAEHSKSYRAFNNQK